MATKLSWLRGLSDWFVWACQHHRLLQMQLTSGEYLEVPTILPFPVQPDVVEEQGSRLTNGTPSLSAPQASVENAEDQHTEHAQQKQVLLRTFFEQNLAWLQADST